VGAVEGAGLAAVEVQAADLVVVHEPPPGACARLRGAEREGPRPLIFAVTAAIAGAIEQDPDGADEYLASPLDAKELRRRLQARLRPRPDPTPPPDTATALGPVAFDPLHRRASVFGEEVVLTRMEVRLLAQLLDCRGHLCGRDILMSAVWGYRRDMNTRTIDAYVRRLREKLGEAGRLIETVRGFGYRMIDREAAL
jgi:two-component system phosphate regulon response regulator PhoB